MTFLLYEIFLEPARGLTKGIRQVYNLSRLLYDRRFVCQGDVAKMDKAGVCKTPIAGSSPAVASTDVEPIAGRQKEAIGHLLSSPGAVAKWYTLRT